MSGRQQRHAGFQTAQHKTELISDKKVVLPNVAPYSNTSPTQSRRARRACGTWSNSLGGQLEDGCIGLLAVRKPAPSTFNTDLPVVKAIEDEAWSKGDLAAINFLCGDGAPSRQLALENVVRHVRLRVLQPIDARTAVEQSLLHALQDLFAAVPLHGALSLGECCPANCGLGEEKQVCQEQGVATA